MRQSQELILLLPLPAPPEDYKVFQELPRKVAQNLCIQVEEIRESSHSLVDVLVPMRMALPLNDAIMDPICIMANPSIPSADSKEN